MKDFNKEYIVQAVSVASNNLRMNSDKIECVSVIKSFLLDDSEIGDKIAYLKKITELSKFAIKIGEINNYLNNNKPDFLTLSENFKNHSHQLIQVLSSTLDNVNSEKLQTICNNYYETNSVEEKNKTSINNNLNKQMTIEPFTDDTNKLKEEIIFDDLSKKEDLDFESYQQRILTPIKGLENLLQRMKSDNYSYEEILSYSEIMNEHFILSQNFGSLIITEMHDVISKGLKMLHDRIINPNMYVLESLRACLIVIVATIKNKNVDITNYLNLAEDFSNKIKEITEEK